MEFGPLRKDSLMQSKLRIYDGPQSDNVLTLEPSRDQRETVSVPLSEILPALAHAHLGRRSWLHDFEDDEVTISSDLYEVILAYQHYRRPGA
jgi:hypothetical protein